jgi:hypothetical protein
MFSLIGGMDNGRSCTSNQILLLVRISIEWLSIQSKTSHYIFNLKSVPADARLDETKHSSSPRSYMLHARDRADLGIIYNDYVR